ncbi:MAG: Transcriptional regulatory protein YycF [Alphaproteobacteria bacterium ADurb.Bin438]|nr:MAG: Transcriptional regulatory protein YycF [Alphaproteobacteria bacterium ADurb.Bin438]
MVNKDFSSCSVLVIEDNLQSQTLIGKFLNLISINNVHYSKNGEDGILKALTVNPDLIILNLNLPNMRGDEVLMKIKATPKIRDIPVLIETSYESQDMKDLMFKAGASDYITKPFSLLEFFSRIKINLENRLLIKTLEKELKKIETELRTAKSMQTWLLPNQNDINGLKSKFGFELSHLFLPSLKLSGDFWGVHQVTHKKVAIFSCSFEEYGLTAALNTFRLNTLIKENPIIYPFKPSSYVESLNKVLHTMLPEGNNVKFIYGIIDFETDTFTYASAGFISPLLISDEKITTLGNGGEPLALSLNTRYTDYSVPFKKGTSIFIYSDTLVKSPYICGRVLGVEGLKETLSKYVNKIDKPDTVFNNIVCEFFTNIESVKSLPDDLTMLMISK